MFFNPKMWISCEVVAAERQILKLLGREIIILGFWSQILEFQLLPNFVRRVDLLYYCK